MSQEKAISAVEAVLVLTQCKELAERLVSAAGGGSRIYLNKEDLATLKAYESVRDTGWTSDREVVGIAGVSLLQLQALDQALLNRRS